MPSRLWLVRHGESTANAGARGETPEGTPLTAQGQEQAKAVVADLVKKVGTPTLVVVSPFLRTHQTAAPFLWQMGVLPQE